MWLNHMIYKSTAQVHLKMGILKANIQYTQLLHNSTNVYA